MKKIFLSETTRPKALISGMKHHLVNLYYFCSNYAPGAKIWARPRGHMICIDLYRENMKKSSNPETTRLRVLIFGMKHHLVNHYQVCSNYAPGAKNGPAPGVTCFA